MAIDWNKLLGLIDRKRAAGIIGFVGVLSAAFAQLPSTAAILIGLISSLFIFILGFLERNNKRSFFKALAIIGMIVGLATLLLFGTVGLILMGDHPSSFDNRAVDEARQFQLEDNQLTNQLTGQHVIKFTREADLAEIDFMPVPDDSKQVKKVSVIRVMGSTEQLGRMRQSLDKHSETQVYFKVEKPAASFDVAVEFKVDLKEASPNPSVRMLAQYKYEQRNRLWRIKSWVFEHYGEQAQ
jgi:hypothetical protein